MYLTYEEYKTLGGTLDSTTFKSYLFYAESSINAVTFRRLTKDKTFPLEVKRCTFEIIQLIDMKYKSLQVSITPNSSGAIEKQSNDGVSVPANATTPRTASNKSSRIILFSVSTFTGS